MDETGIQEHTCFRSHAWSKVGEKITIRLPAKSREEFIITKRGNQIKSKSKTFSAIAIFQKGS